MFSFKAIHNKAFIEFMEQSPRETEIQPVLKFPPSLEEET
jgi:hypothetical protein